MIGGLVSTDTSICAWGAENDVELAHNQWFQFARMRREQDQILRGNGVAKLLACLDGPRADAATTQRVLLTLRLLTSLLPAC